MHAAGDVTCRALHRAAAPSERTRLQGMRMHALRACNWWRLTKQMLRGRVCAQAGVELECLLEKTRGKVGGVLQLSSEGSGLRSAPAASCSCCGHPLLAVGTASSIPVGAPTAKSVAQRTSFWRDVALLSPAWDT